MKTNHQRNFRFNPTNRNAWLKGTSRDRQCFLKRYWKKFRHMSKAALKKNKELPIFKGDEFWEMS